MLSAGSQLRSTAGDSSGLSLSALAVETGDAAVHNRFVAQTVGITAEQLTLQHVHHLREAWHHDRSQLESAELQISQNNVAIDQLQAKLQQQSLELRYAVLSGDLATFITSPTGSGRPGHCLKKITEWMPQDLQELTTLHCLVRSGYSDHNLDNSNRSGAQWTLWSSNNPDEYRVIHDQRLDRIVEILASDDQARLQLVPLSGVGLTSTDVTFLTSELFENLTSMEWQLFANCASVVAASSHCLWAVGASSEVLQLTAAPQSGATELPLQLLQRLGSGIQSSIGLGGGSRGLWERLSQLLMQSHIGYMEAQAKLVDELSSEISSSLDLEKVFGGSDVDPWHHLISPTICRSLKCVAVDLVTATMDNFDSDNTLMRACSLGLGRILSLSASQQQQSLVARCLITNRAVVGELPTNFAGPMWATSRNADQKSREVPLDSGTFLSLGIDSAHVHSWDSVPTFSLLCVPLLHQKFQTAGSITATALVLRFENHPVSDRNVTLMTARMVVDQSIDVILQATRRSGAFARAFFPLTSPLDAMVGDSKVLMRGLAGLMSAKFVEDDREQKLRLGVNSMESNRALDSHVEGVDWSMFAVAIRDSSGSDWCALVVEHVDQTLAPTMICGEYLTSFHPDALAPGWCNLWSQAKEKRAAADDHEVDSVIVSANNVLPPLKTKLPSTSWSAAAWSAVVIDRNGHSVQFTWLLAASCRRAATSSAPNMGFDAQWMQLLLNDALGEHNQRVLEREVQQLRSGLRDVARAVRREAVQCAQVSTLAASLETLFAAASRCDYLALWDMEKEYQPSVGIFSPLFSGESVRIASPYANSSLNVGMHHQHQTPSSVSHLVSARMSTHDLEGEVADAEFIASRKDTLKWSIRRLRGLWSAIASRHLGIILANSIDIGTDASKGLEPAAILCIIYMEEMHGPQSQPVPSTEATNLTLAYGSSPTGHNNSSPMREWAHSNQINRWQLSRSGDWVHNTSSTTETHESNFVPIFEFPVGSSLELRLGIQVLDQDYTEHSLGMCEAANSQLRAVLARQLTDPARARVLVGNHETSLADNGTEDEHPFADGHNCDAVAAQVLAAAMATTFDESHVTPSKADSERLLWSQSVHALNGRIARVDELVSLPVFSVDGGTTNDDEEGDAMESHLAVTQRSAHSGYVQLPRRLSRAVMQGLRQSVGSISGNTPSSLLIPLEGVAGTAADFLLEYSPNLLPQLPNVDAPFELFRAATTPNAPSQCRAVLLHVVRGPSSGSSQVNQESIGNNDSNWLLALIISPPISSSSNPGFLSPASLSRMLQAHCSAAQIVAESLKALAPRLLAHQVMLDCMGSNVHESANSSSLLIDENTSAALKLLNEDKVVVSSSLSYTLPDGIARAIRSVLSRSESSSGSATSTLAGVGFICIESLRIQQADAKSSADVLFHRYCELSGRSLPSHMSAEWANSFQLPISELTAIPLLPLNIGYPTDDCEGINVRFEAIPLDIDSNSPPAHHLKLGGLVQGNQYRQQSRNSSFGDSRIKQKATIIRIVFSICIQDKQDIAGNTAYSKELPVAYLLLVIGKPTSALKAPNNNNDDVEMLPWKLSAAAAARGLLPIFRGFLDIQKLYIQLEQKRLAQEQLEITAGRVGHELHLAAREARQAVESIVEAHLSVKPVPGAPLSVDQLVFLCHDYALLWKETTTNLNRQRTAAVDLHQQLQGSRQLLARASMFAETIEALMHPSNSIHEDTPVSSSSLSEERLKRIAAACALNFRLRTQLINRVVAGGAGGVAALLPCLQYAAQYLLDIADNNSSEKESSFGRFAYQLLHPNEGRGSTGSQLLLFAAEELSAAALDVSDKTSNGYSSTIAAQLNLRLMRDGHWTEEQTATSVSLLQQALHSRRPLQLLSTSDSVGHKHPLGESVTRIELLPLPAPRDSTSSHGESRNRDVLTTRDVSAIAVAQLIHRAKTIPPNEGAVAELSNRQSSTAALSPMESLVNDFLSHMLSTATRQEVTHRQKVSDDVNRSTGQPRLLSLDAAISRLSTMPAAREDIAAYALGPKAICGALAKQLLHDARIVCSVLLRTDTALVDLSARDYNYSLSATNSESTSAIGLLRAPVCRWSDGDCQFDGSSCSLPESESIACDPGRVQMVNCILGGNQEVCMAVDISVELPGEGTSNGCTWNLRLIASYGRSRYATAEDLATLRHAGFVLHAMLSSYVQRCFEAVQSRTSAELTDSGDCLRRELTDRATEQAILREIVELASGLTVAGDGLGDNKPLETQLQKILVSVFPGDRDNLATLSLVRVTRAELSRARGVQIRHPMDNTAISKSVTLAAATLAANVPLLLRQVDLRCDICVPICTTTTAHDPVADSDIDQDGPDEEDSPSSWALHIQLPQVSVPNDLSGLAAALGGVLLGGSVSDVDGGAQRWPDLSFAALACRELAAVCRQWLEIQQLVQHEVMSTHFIQLASAMGKSITYTFSDICEQIHCESQGEREIIDSMFRLAAVIAVRLNDDQGILVGTDDFNVMRAKDSDNEGIVELAQLFWLADQNTADSQATIASSGNWYTAEKVFTPNYLAGNKEHATVSVDKLFEMRLTKGLDRGLLGQLLAAPDRVVVSTVGSDTEHYGWATVDLWLDATPVPTDAHVELTPSSSFSRVIMHLRLRINPPTNHTSAYLHGWLRGKLGQLTLRTIGSNIRAVALQAVQSVRSLGNSRQQLRGIELLAANRSEVLSAVAAALAELSVEGRKVDKTLRRAHESLCRELSSERGVHAIALTCSLQGDRYSSTSQSDQQPGTPVVYSATLRSGWSASTSVNLSAGGLEDFPTYRAAFVNAALNTNTAITHNNDAADDRINDVVGFSSRHGVEFAFECFEVTGRLVVFYEAHAPESLGRVPDGSGGWVSARTLARHRSECRALFESLVRTIARRVLEVHRSQAQRQQITQTSAELSAARKQAADLAAQAAELEASRGAALSESVIAIAESDQLRSRLRAEQAAAHDAVTQHKALSQHTRRALQDMRTECAKKEAALQRTLASARDEHRQTQMALSERDKDIAKLRRELDKVQASEAAKKDVSSKLAELEKTHAALTAESKDVIPRLERELETVRAQLRQALLREEATLGEQDTRAKVLLDRLQLAERELAASRTGLSHATQQLSTATAVMKRQEESAARQEAVADELRQQKQRLQLALEEATRRLGDVEAEVGRLQALRDADQSRILSLKDQLKVMQLEHSSMVQAFQK